jgi:DNA-directed RNA polymerase specialized sigma24 family protein
LDDTDAPGGSSDFQQELLAIRQDPQVRWLALKWARKPDLAEDDLQTAYLKVAQVKNRIENLRGYYLRTLRNEAVRRYALPPEVPLEDPDTALDPARPVDERVCNSLRDRSWLQRLAEQRDRLLAAIPARSEDPVRYRRMIFTIAEQVLRDTISGETSDADSNDHLRADYPAYFAQPGAPANTCHQRFCRAREDVRALLQTVVNRDEII